MGFFKTLIQKLNPAQKRIAEDEGTAASTQTKLMTVQNAYKLVEVVNRSINMIVDSASQVEYDVKGSFGFTPKIPNVRSKTLNTLLNHRPNLHMDISTFRRLLFMDFLIDGNAFIHFDGTALYHLPATSMEIVADEETYVNHYLYDGTIEFPVNKVIHIKDNSATSVLRGDSRINSTLNSLISRETMMEFQSQFFENGAVVGLVIETDVVLSTPLKERKEKEWVKKYNPKSGSKKPLILDAGMKLKHTNDNTFKDMAFNESISDIERKAATGLGVPSVLLDSGNNANLRPNIELFYSMTVIPMVRKFEAAFEYAFGFDVELTTHSILALKPDQKIEADRLSGLVNNGIIIGNEAREVLRLETLDDPLMDKIRIPANVAGSATQVAGQQGGKPADEDS